MRVQQKGAAYMYDSCRTAKNITYDVAIVPQGAPWNETFGGQPVDLKGILPGFPSTMRDALCWGA